MRTCLLQVQPFRAIRVKKFHFRIVEPSGIVHLQMILQELEIEVQVKELGQEPGFFRFAHVHGQMKSNQGIFSMYIEVLDGPVLIGNPEMTFQQLGTLKQRNYLDVVSPAVRTLQHILEKILVQPAGRTAQGRQDFIFHHRRAVEVELHVIHDVEHFAIRIREGSGNRPDFPVINIGRRIMQIADGFMHILVDVFLQLEHGRYIFDNPVTLMYRKLPFQIQATLVFLDAV